MFYHLFLFTSILLFYGSLYFKKRLRIVVTLHVTFIYVFFIYCINTFIDNFYIDFNNIIF